MRPFNSSAESMSKMEVSWASQVFPRNLLGTLNVLGELAKMVGNWKAPGKLPMRASRVHVGTL